MRVSRRSKSSERRFGVAATEFAVILPVLAFLCVLAVDWARVFYYSLTIANCARNGVLYESDPYVRAESPYANVTQAALADASNLNDPTNPPTVSSTWGVDADGRQYVAVTVSYQFRTITNFPVIPSTMNLTRTVRMARAPLNPSS